MQPLITLKEAEKILRAKEGEVKVSLDLGKSLTTVTKTVTHLRIPLGPVEGKPGEGQAEVLLSALKKVKEKTCYLIEDGALKPVAFFSDESQFYYKLVPTKDWPTITFSSTPMHTLESPKKRTEGFMREVSTALAAQGRALDTCFGLGYTAIALSRKAVVDVFEKDPYPLHIAGINPWSVEAFQNERIKIHETDITDGIKQFKSGTFECIIHDPPTPAYARDLYEAPFHRELYRVLKKGGVLFHYVANPKKTKGDLFYPKIVKSLEKAGFVKVEYHVETSGIRAVK